MYPALFKISSYPIYHIAITVEDWEESSDQSWETESEDSDWSSNANEDDADDDDDDEIPSDIEGKVMENLQDILDEHVSEREKADIGENFTCWQIYSVDIEL